MLWSLPAGKPRSRVKHDAQHLMLSTQLQGCSRHILLSPHGGTSFLNERGGQRKVSPGREEKRLGQTAVKLAGVSLSYPLHLASLERPWALEEEEKKDRVWGRRLFNNLLGPPILYLFLSSVGEGDHILGQIGERIDYAAYGSISPILSSQMGPP